MMGKKRVRGFWGLLLLPLLLRSLIPVGFMPMVGPNFSLRLTLCDDYAPLPWDSAQSAPMSADMVMDDDAMSAHMHGGHPAHGDHGSCPFGASPALGALPSLDSLAITADRAVEPRVVAAQIEHFEVSFRAQSPRGPPA